MNRPQGNAVVLAVLRSPAHRLLSGMAIERARIKGQRHDGVALVVDPDNPCADQPG